MARHQEQQIAISDYREFRAPPVLAEYLLCFWTQTISPSSEFTQRVLPDCCVDIILMNEVPMVIGPWTEPFDANLPAGTNVLGVRCHPGLASSLLGVPASELLNLSVPLCDLWGSGGTAAFTRIGDEIAVAARMSAMETALLARVAKASPVDIATKAGIQWIARHPHGRVEQLSRGLVSVAGKSSVASRRRWGMVRSCSSPCSVSSVFSIWGHRRRSVESRSVCRRRRVRRSGAYGPGGEAVFGRAAECNASILAVHPPPIQSYLGRG